MMLSSSRGLGGGRERAAEECLLEAREKGREVAIIIDAFMASATTKAFFSSSPPPAAFRAALRTRLATSFRGVSSPPMKASRSRGGESSSTWSSTKGFIFWRKSSRDCRDNRSEWGSFFFFFFFAAEKRFLFHFLFLLLLSLPVFQLTTTMPDDDDSSSSFCSGDSSDDDSPSDRDWDDWGEGANGGGGENAHAAAAAANANNSDDEEETATTSLFDNSAVLPSASAALAHDAKEHGFDLVEFKKKVKRGSEREEKRLLERELRA